MALGARSSGVVVAVLRRFLVLLAAGAVAGLGASAGLTRLVETWVYGVKPADAATLGAACGFLVVVAAVASAAPALRAARMDPMSVLRED
jgi:ABC-type antimicrobial peptide transport system permease subunit